MFSFILVLILLWILGIIVFFILKPLVKNLANKGIITEKRKKQINLGYLIVLTLLSLLLFYYKDYRTPSSERLEQNCSLKIPINYKVLKDDFQDMMQDYFLYYNIEFDESVTKDLTMQVRSSKYFNPIPLYQGILKKRVF